MLRIGIDARFAVHKRRGIGNYTLKLIQNLAEIDFDNQYILYIDKEDSDHVLPMTSNFTTKIILPSNYLVWEQIILPIQARKDAVDILHCTGNTAPVFLDKRIRLITTIHDVMFLIKYSELPKPTSLYQKAGRLYRKIIVPRTIRHLSMALAVSEFTKSDIIKHIPEIDNARIKVVHEAANESFRRVGKSLNLQDIINNYDMKDGYVLTLGALDPRKNTELVIKKYIELKNENKIKEKLVIVGIPAWEKTKLYSIGQKSNFKKDIIFTNFISEDDLCSLYNCATVFLYPSLYEGFGIPPLEAMSCGTPVITSNTTSIPEVVKDAAFLINPQDGEELKAALLKLLNDKKLRNTLISRGLEQAKIFSWVKMAEETLKIYEEKDVDLYPKKKDIHSRSLYHAEPG